jgi:small subunit ribosomal protein S3
MGQKIHPIGVRLGITREPHSFWYAKGKQYGVLVEEDTVLRNYIFQRYRQSRVSGIDIERRKEGIRLRIESSKTKLLVGTNGQELENLTHKIKKSASNFENLFRKMVLRVLKKKLNFVKNVKCKFSFDKYLAPIRMLNV